MKDIVIGLIIAIVVFIIGDFIYTEKNECIINNNGKSEVEKCGFLKKQLDINIDLFDRYW